jgi:hypothetical protein
MADHVRKQIRDAAVTALANLTTTGARCYPQPERRLADASCPALLVYLHNEASRRSAFGGGIAGGAARAQRGARRRGQAARPPTRRRSMTSST